MFNIIGADIEINKEITQIKFTGTFPDEIKFKRAQTQEIKTISLTYTKNKITLSVPYLDKKNKQQNRILFEENY